MKALLWIWIVLAPLSTWAARPIGVDCPGLLTNPPTEQNPNEKVEEGAMRSPQDVIDKLGLQPLPGEGGYFKETYRSPTFVAADRPASDGEKRRSLTTQIYYMVTDTSYSVLHRLQFDEVYHFYSGTPAEIFVIYPDGRSALIKLGSNLAAGEVPQVVIPAGSWQGVRIASGHSGNWSLMGTTVAPGFDFADFELGKRSELLATYPELAESITVFTHPDPEAPLTCSFGPDSSDVVTYSGFMDMNVEAPISYYGELFRK